MALATAKSLSALNRSMLMFFPSMRPFGFRLSSTARTPSSTAAAAEGRTMGTRGSLPPTDLRWCQSESTSTAEASRIRQNPNSSRRITAHILIVSNRKSKFHWLLRFRRLTEFKLFGNNPVARYAERPELSGEVGNESDLATQHHSIIFQRRDLGCDLSRGDPPTGRCCP